MRPAIKKPSIGTPQAPAADKPDTKAKTFVAPAPLANIGELRSYLMIDKDALDDMLQEQPDLMFRVSEVLEQAVSLRDQAKEYLAVTDAECATHYRGKEEKATESKIRDAVQLDSRHAVAFETYMHWKKETGVLGALKDAFEQRGHRLRDLGNLYVSGYFSTSAHKQATGAVQDRRAEEGRAAMAAKRRTG